MSASHKKHVHAGRCPLPGKLSTSQKILADLTAKGWLGCSGLALSSPSTSSISSSSSYCRVRTADDVAILAALLGDLLGDLLGELAEELLDCSDEIRKKIMSSGWLLFCCDDRAWQKNKNKNAIERNYRTGLWPITDPKTQKTQVSNSPQKLGLLETLVMWVSCKIMYT
jgi:hypothetical protein